MTRTALAVFSVLLILATAGFVWWFREPIKSPPAAPPAAELPSRCRAADFEAVSYIVCEIDTAVDDVALFLASDGKPFGSLPAFDKAMKEERKPVLLAMNAGMYHEDLSPVGLFVGDGEMESPLNLADGEGNFFMKPNGVFFVGRDGRAGVMETAAFAALNPDVLQATQSGPMLVVDGRIHPRFEQNGASRFIRNGVGIAGSGKVVLAISRSEVSLGSFARLFRDALGCRNALFFDGAISALSDGEKMIVGGEHRAGPILAVRARHPAGEPQSR